MVSGGVACNSLLRHRFTRLEGLPVTFPSPALSTDNAAMIAAAAYPKLVAGRFSALDLAADPQLAL
jgi:N6-L-threonylcarbamoyladenine synthase